MSEKVPAPLNEEALDKMIGILEGPVNKTAEKILSSTIVLAPLSIGMNLSMRVLGRVMGRSKKNGSAQ